MLQPAAAFSSEVFRALPPDSAVASLRRPAPHPVFDQAAVVERMGPV
jgi:hypothetical protein